MRLYLSQHYAGKILLASYDQLNQMIGSNFVIQGSYNTSNIGDLTIGFIINKILNDSNYKCHLNGTILGMIPNFRRYKYHIIGGGGVIRDYPNNYLNYRLFPIKSNKKSYVIGVGVPGIKTNYGRKTLKRIEDCGLITVRDKNSKTILSQYIDSEIHLTACPAFLFDVEKKSLFSKRDSNYKHIGINLRPLHSPNWSDYLFFPQKINYNKMYNYYYEIIKYIKNYIKTNKAHYYFIPFALEDYQFAKNIFNEKEIKLLPLQTIDKTLNFIYNMDAMICTRYHSLVYSIIAEKPSFVIGYSDKVIELCQQTLKRDYINLIEPEKIDIDIKNIQKNDIKKVKSQMIKNAMKNFDLLNEIIYSEYI